MALGRKIFEGLVSTGVVYLLSPTLLSVLAPVQAKINAGAINNGQTPSTNGINALANKLLTPATPPATPLVAANPLSNLLTQTATLLSPSGSAPNAQ